MRGLEAMINAFKNSKFCDKIFHYKKKKSQFSFPTNIIKNCGSDRNKKLKNKEREKEKLCKRLD